VNAGTYAGAGATTWLVNEKTISSNSVACEMGAMVKLGDFIRVYFPFITTRDLAEVNGEYAGNYLQTIRYVIDLNAINPFRLRERLFK
jgi:hypothetical protein